MRISRKSLRVLVAVAVLLVGGYGLLLLALVLAGPAEVDEWLRPRPRMRFSESEWKRTRFGDAERYKMANDLVSSKRLLRSAESEVIVFLGHPDWRQTVGPITFFNYELTHQSKFPSGCIILPSFLFFNTDTWLLEVQCVEGHVVKAGIRHT